MVDPQQQLTAQVFFRFYEKTFDDLYRYCARRVSTKPVIAFMMKALYEHALDEIAHGNAVTLVDLYQWAYEFLVVQQQTSARGGPVKRINDFRDVYDVKTDSASRTIRREELLENFYTQLEYKEREVLWLTFFEQLSDLDRARVMGISGQECINFFYEVLKKARQVVTTATAHHKGQAGFSTLSSYFGGVSSLLKKIREDESIVVDQEIYQSLRTVFSDQFARQGVILDSSVAAEESAREPSRAANTAHGNPPPSSRLDDYIDERADDEISATSWASRLQGAVALVVVAIVVVFGYQHFVSLDARVERLLDDTRIRFSDDFSSDDKTRVAREVLITLVKGRDFAHIAVQRVGSDVGVVIADSNKPVNEAFRLYPYNASFDFQFKWQPREYHRTAAVRS